MCEHTRRPKLFCILQTCTKGQCCACITCLKNIHGHSSEHYLDEKEITYLLTRFDPPTTFKEERKNAILKMYKFLTKFKSQISNKLEQMVSNLMSKVKYPYLYQAELLQSYRNLRDKNYQRLNPHKFRHFCKIAKNLSGNQFIDKQKDYYSQHLLDVQEEIKGFGQKIKVIEKTLNFDLTPDLMKLHQEFMIEADSFKRTNKISKSLEKKDYSVIKQKNPLNSSVKLQKKPMQFLTPTKPTISLDISLQNLSFQSSGDHRSRKQSQTIKADFKDNTLLNLDFEQQIKRVNTSQEQNKSGLKIIKESDSKTVKSSDQNKTVNQESPIKMIPKMNMSDLYNYEDQISNSYKIKISSSDKEDQNNKNKSSFQHMKDNFLTSSIQFDNKAGVKEDQARKMSYHEQMLKMSIKDREEHVKARITQLQKDKSPLNDDKNVLKDSVKLKKEFLNTSSKKALEPASNIGHKKSPTKTNDIKSYNSQKSKDNLHLFTPPSLEKKINRDFNPLSSKKQVKPSIKQPQISLTESKSNLMNSKKSPKKTNNVSLGKQFVHYESEKSNQNITLQFRNATKEIPLVQSHSKESPPPRKLLKKKSFQITQDEQLQASAILVAKLEQIKNPAKAIDFLEKYTDKFQNCLSAAQYLSYLYLQHGKLKQCFSLTSRYLQKLDYLKVSEPKKVGLAINKSAALNQLGRYSEVIAFLKKYEGVENDRVHKNIGDALFNLGTIDRAIYHYQKATKLNERYDEAYYNLAVILYMQESYYNAKMNIDKAIRWQPKNSAYIQLLEGIKGRITACQQ